MRIQTVLAERPENVVMFDTDAIVRIDLVGGVAGLSLRGSVAQVRISRDDYDRLRMHFKAQVLSDMPAPVRHRDEPRPRP